MKGVFRWFNYEDRLIDKIDRKKAEENIRRGSAKKGRIIRTETGLIKRVVIAS